MNIEYDNSQAFVKVDFIYLYEFSGGDENFVKEIVEIFIQEVLENIVKLLEGLIQEDWDMVYRMVYQLKFNYMMFGMFVQQEIVFFIEKIVKIVLVKD